MKKVNLGKTIEQVSELCLGTMYFGSRVNKNDAFRLMDYYVDQGGNYLDTANNYCYWLGEFTGDESENTIGDWLNERKNRSEIFLATKCGARPNVVQDKASHEGLSKKAIISAADQSLKRLKTDYIDLYYMHVDWREEPLEETIEAFNDLVLSGKVRQIGCSNIDTWRVLKAKEISRKHKWIEFSAVQNWYSYLQPRYKADMWVQKYVNEELLDYVKSENDLTIMSYTSTLGGAYNWNSIYDKNHPALGTRFFSEDNERRLKAIQELANSKQSSVYQVLFAWLMKQSIIPILGVRNIEQLKENLGSAYVSLSKEEMLLLEEAAFNDKSFLNNEVVNLL